MHIYPGQVLTCRNEEQYIASLKKLSRLGYKWASGYALIEEGLPHHSYSYGRKGLLFICSDKEITFGDARGATDDAIEGFVEATDFLRGCLKNQKYNDSLPQL